MIAVLIMFSFLISGCNLLPEEEIQEPPELIEPPEPNIVTETVQRGSIREEITGLARVAAAEESDLYFTRDGRVGEVLVSYNDIVEKGERLAQLEIEDLEFEYELALLDLKKERMALERKESLVGHEISEFELEMARIDLQKLEMRIDRMADRLAASTIYAPFEGRVTSISMRETDYIEEYTSVISIADPSELELHMRVSASDLQQLVSGLEAEIILEDGTLVEAVVTEVPSLSAEISPGTPDRRVRLKLKNPAETAQRLGREEDELLEYDTLLRSRIILQKREDTLLLSRGAVREYGDRTFVRILEDDVRREVDVKLGLESDNRVEVLDGLQEGDEVISH